MAYACRTSIVLALLGLFVASAAHRAAAAELPFTILDRDDWYGSSGSMCENVGAPPDEMRCIATADHRLLGQRLLLDFGQPVALSAFANAAPPGLSNERETLYALATPNSSLDLALAEISVTQVNDLGLHAEFPAVVARYVLGASTPLTKPAAKARASGRPSPAAPTASRTACTSTANRPPCRSRGGWCCWGLG